MLKACPLLGGVQGCIAPPKFPNLQKSPPNCCLRAKQVWKIGILCIFGQRNNLKFRKRSSFVRFAPSEAKKKKKLQKFCKNAHIQKIRKRSTFDKFAPSSDKNAWLKPVKCIGLGSKGGLGAEPLNILKGGAGVSFSPPKKSYILKNLDWKRAWNYAYI